MKLVRRVMPDMLLAIGVAGVLLGALLLNPIVALIVGGAMLIALAVWMGV